MKSKSTVYSQQSNSKSTDYTLQTSVNSNLAVVRRPWTVDHIRGFTLIEILVAIGIIGIIFATIILTTNGLNRRGRDTRRVQDLRQIQSAIQNFYADNHYYPDTSFNTTFLTTGNSFTVGTRTYLEPTPQDPNIATTTPYCYQPYVTRNTTSACSNAVNSTTKCEYYQLCAELEDPDSTAVPCTCNSINYNYSVEAP
jgi:prepilin-type N-terminal cleavage/methylation domain-containing protein